jgi:hypothetical protein
MALSLICGDASVTLSRYPVRTARSLEVVQSVPASVAGVRFGGAAIADERTWPLRWEGMSIADLEALLTFVRDDLQFMDETFVLGEPMRLYEGVGLQSDDGAGGQEDFIPAGGEVVRLASPEITYAETAPGRYVVTLTVMEG